MQYYAHSGNKALGILPQRYQDHVHNVLDFTALNVDRVLLHSDFNDAEKTFFRQVCLVSALYHDIGKLDDSIQRILNQDEYSDEKILNHVDAGVALTLKLYESSKNIVYLYASYFIHCHHIGLQNWEDLIIIKYDPIKFGVSNLIPNYKIRDSRILANIYENLKSKYITVKDHIDGNLAYYKQIHDDLVGKDIIQVMPVDRNLEIQTRMAFSCFINADHQDTANHYKTNIDKFYDNKRKYTLFAEERIKFLDKYVGGINTNGVDVERLNVRNNLYNVCSKVTFGKFNVVDSIVGSGKTLSGLKLALRIAKETNADRIITIIPFTNVIQQTVDEYRKAILLPKEDEIVVNEIHSKCEFENSHLRKYSNTWSAPVNVSTAVQFFESLTKGNTGSIKKLCNFANSVVILDEFHNSMPHYYWDYILNLLNELAKFNVHFVFSSGSSVYYWDLFNKSFDVNEILPKNTFVEFQKHEKERVKCVLNKKNFNFKSIKEFYTFVMESGNNSILIVMNTIKNSIITAKYFKKNCNTHKLYQLSGSLTPKDRAKILNKIKQSLTNKEKIILIATSIVECGIDFSFDIGFREKCGMLSYLQFNGRINRNGKLKNAKSIMFDFSSSIKTNNGNGIYTINPQLIPGINVLNSLPKSKITPEYCSSAVELEIKANPPVNDFVMLEKRKRFKEISKKFNVIDADTITIIVDKIIGEKMLNGEYVCYQDIIKNSVQKWSNYLDKVANRGILQTIDSQTFFWKGEYDSEFYGLKD
jgi:CRISPR-associated helicase Cas3